MKAFGVVLLLLAFAALAFAVSETSHPAADAETVIVQDADLSPAVPASEAEVASRTDDNYVKLAGIDHECEAHILKLPQFAESLTVFDGIVFGDAIYAEAARHEVAVLAVGVWPDAAPVARMNLTIADAETHPRRSTGRPST